MEGKDPIAFLFRGETNCPYFRDGRTATIEYLLPSEEDVKNFHLFLAKGYRRLDAVLYRNVCEECSACVPIRISVSSPRIQEFIARHAPKEKAGLYVGTNFLAVGVGAFSGVIYTPVYGRFAVAGHPGWVWYAIAAHVVAGLAVIALFLRLAGTMEERAVG